MASHSNLLGVGVFAAALLASPLYAFASVVHLFSVVPTTVTEGEQSQLDLTLTLTADPGYFNSLFTGGTVTLDSGTGPSQNFVIPSGVALASFSFSFLYPTAGSYSPSFSYTAAYSQQMNQFVSSSVWVSSGYVQYYTYSCGFFSTCTGSYWVDTSHWETRYSYQLVTQNFTGNGSDSASLLVNSIPQGAVSQTPLPAALPLFATGFGALGLAAWRRKRGSAKHAV